MPVLVVIGETTCPICIKRQIIWPSSCRERRSSSLPNAAHLPNMEHPALFEARVRAFLAAV